MNKLDIGSMVRVKDNYYVASLIGKIGKVVSRIADDELVTVQFKGMEDHRDLHDGNLSSDRTLDGKRDKRYISPKDLELIEKENKQMTKNDLKSGMTVKLRNGDISLVINDFITNNNSFLSLTEYDDNLVCTDDYTELDIVEVYQFTNWVTNLHVGRLPILLDLTNPSMKLLWKRQELPKLSRVSCAERVILENLDKRCKWIARDKSEKLFAYYTKPNKDTPVWSPVDMNYIALVFPNLFTFVKWEDEEAYSIDELLKGEQ